MDRIYVAALRMSPDNYLLWHSRGISAKVPALGREAKTGAHYRKLSLQYLHRAAELAPDDPQIAYSLGKWHYEFCEEPSGEQPEDNPVHRQTRVPAERNLASPDRGEVSRSTGRHGILGSVEEALAAFERTLQLDPDHGFARLFRAHCLHDMKRWREAVTAYEAVPLETFKGKRAWLVDVVLEAKAYCKLKAGNRDGALEDFDRLLTRLEREPQRKEPLLLKWLWRACRGPLREQLGARYRKI